MAQIAFERVSKFYGNERALHEVLLALSDNVITAVVGPAAAANRRSCN